MRDVESAKRFGRVAVAMLIAILASAAAAEPLPPLFQVNLAPTRSVPLLPGLAYALLAGVLVLAPVVLRLQRAAWDDPLDPRYGARPVGLTAASPSTTSSRF